ncbi:MAG: MerR family transcriptional regulator [Planctomycetaceae bacterium]|nr:MerR family transcriptional regulator [Planctomycetaceae bacterium]
MTPSIIPREQVAQKLSVPTQLLIRYEAHGLIRPVRQGTVEGYEPAEIRRIWTILSCQRDLGINLAGVEAILKLRDHLAEVHRQLDVLTRRLREALEDEIGTDPDA